MPSILFLTIPKSASKPRLGFSPWVHVMIACWPSPHPAHSRLEILIMIFPHLFLILNHFYILPTSIWEEHPRNWVEHCCLPRWKLRESYQTLSELSFINELGEEKVPLNSKMFNYNTRETLICTITIYILPQFIHPLISALHPILLNS